MLLQRVTDERLSRKLDELRRDDPRRRQELRRRQSDQCCQGPYAEECNEARDAQQDQLAKGQWRLHRQRARHGIARSSSHPSARAVSPPATATPIMPTTIIAGKISSPA